MPALDGIVVLDFSRVLSGPYCTMQLADLGARVIKIEAPGRGDDTRAWGPPFLGDQSTYFMSINRNKESIAIDLKHVDSQRVIERLLERADVVVENFRPGTMDRLGYGYERVAAAHPRIVYCSISGFGQTGPRSREAGYDAVMQAEVGLMSVTGDADGPPFRLGVAIADIATGLFAAQGILAALIARERTGRGQRVDVGMLDSVAALLSYQAGIVFATGTSPGRMGNRHPSIAPYDTFAASDGEFVLAVGNDEQFQRLATVIERPELASDPRYLTNRSRVEHYGQLRASLAESFQHWRRDGIVETLTAAGVPCGSVRTVTEALADPQLAARDMIVPLEHVSAGHVRVLGNPIKMTDTPTTVRMPPPVLGAHTETILERDLGFEKDEIDELRRVGAIA
jgi:formyl-CoA transferase/CoA:oxalate CoA-transferase